MASVSQWAARHFLRVPSHCRASSDGEEYVMTLKDEPEGKKTIEYGVDRRTILLGGPMLVAASSSLGAVASAQPLAADPLPSWNDGATKKSITDFVARVTTQSGADFVPPDQRIATFDNDGTLWIEQPIYVQLAFILDRTKALAPQNPDWKTTQPFKAVLEGDMKALAASGEKGLMQLMAATHAGMTSDQFTKIVSDWLATARDQRFKRPYTELVYQP